MFWPAIFPSASPTRRARSRKSMPSTSQRWRVLPPLEDPGLAGYESIGWFGFVAPAGTPGDIIGRLNRAIVAALEDTALRDQILVIGAEPMPGTPEEFGRFIRSEYEKWAKVVAQSGAKQK